MRGISPFRTNALFLLLFTPVLLAQRSPNGTIQRTSVQIGSAPQLVIRQLRISGSKDFVEIEVDANDRISPVQSQMLTGPDRLVLDFPNAVPGADLRSQSIYVGAVKDIRAGLFRSKPPITRVVIDLDSPETYQIFPSGRIVMIKMSTGAASGSATVDPWREPAVQPGLAASVATLQPSTPPAPPRPSLEVGFANGLLSIKADRVSLAEILRGVQQRTGAEISIASGADQEKVVSDLGPAPAQEVLARLLHGSKFNFLILNAAEDPKKLDRVILTPRTEGGPTPLPPLQTADQPTQPEPGFSPREPGPPQEPHFPPPQPEANVPPEPPPDPQ
jgi:AMIN domain